MEADVQYWADLNWQAGAIPVNIAGESLGHRQGLMYFSLINGKYVRFSTLVVQTVECEQGVKLKAIQGLCRRIGFEIADSKYSPHRKSETYYIWIQDRSYWLPELGWLSDYILTTYPEDVIAVQPMVSDKPFGGIHNEGSGASF
jgi:hypothetical protein